MGASYNVGDIRFNITAKATEITQTLNKLSATLTGISSKTRIFSSNLAQTSANIVKTNNNLKKSKTNLDKISKSAEITGKSLKTAFSIGKLYAFFNYTKRIGMGIMGMVSSAINFEETLNKFQVSMGSYYSQAVRFVNKLTYAFNLSTESVMNYMATFKNMLDAIGGLGEQQTYEITETLTRMAIDYASLFNVSIDKAMQQFQATLSGQIRNIRTTSGYDVSEASIFAIYQELGGTKTVRQLDQIEKRLLRIIAVQRQMESTGAVGDFAKTINKSAQQIKQIQENFKEIERWIGQLAMVYLEPLLEKLLVGTIVLREVLKSLAIDQGYKYESSGEGGLFGEITQSADEAEESVNKLKKSLLGFDKLNILGQTTTSTIGSDYSLLLDSIKGYSNSVGDVQNRANKTAESFLEWLGYTKQTTINIDEMGNEVENVSWYLKDGNTNMSNILESAKTLLTTIGVMIGVKHLGGVKNILDYLGNIESSPIPAMGVLLVGVVSSMASLADDSETYKNNIQDTLDIINQNLEIFKVPDLSEWVDGFKLVFAQIGEFFLELVSLITGLFSGLFTGDWTNFIESWRKLFGENASYDSWLEEHGVYRQNNDNFSGLIGIGARIEVPEFLSKEYWSNIWGNIKEIGGHLSDKEFWENVGEGLGIKKKRNTNYISNYENYNVPSLDYNDISPTGIRRADVEEIISAIRENKDTYLDGRVVSEQLYPSLQKEARRRTGKSDLIFG